VTVNLRQRGKTFKDGKGQVALSANRVPRTVRKGISMKRIATLTVAAAFLVTSAMAASAQDLAAQIVGVWKFVSNSNKETATGKIMKPYGEKPNGYIVYTKGGRVIFSLVAGEGRPKPGASGATDAERATLFRSLATGSGTYKVEGDAIIVTYDSSWHEVWTGTTQKRNIAISGNKLTQTSAPTKNADGQEIIFENVLEKVE